MPVIPDDSVVYADLAAVKAALHIADTERDDQIEQAIAAASRSIDRATGRRFWADGVATARTFRVAGKTVRTRDGEKLLIDDVSALTDLAVAVGTLTAYSTVTGWETLPDNALDRDWPVTALLMPGGGWGGPRVRVTAVWGWPVIPDDIVQAAQILAIRLWKRKDSPEGVLGNAEWGTVRLSRTDPDVAALISPFKLPGFG